MSRDKGGTMSSSPDVLVIGGGLAGLCCGFHLHQRGLAVQVLEASDGIGGRVRTDQVDGFLLDRGFQVLLTAYPEAQRVLDYAALDLRPFYPGALIRYGGRFHRFADPWRHPLDGLSGLFSPVGTFADKLKTPGLRRRALAGSLSELYHRPETTTLQWLRTLGFSEAMIDRFFKPFIGGVFLDPDLEVSSRMFEFCFRMFALADTAVPSGGMGAISHQMASRLPKEIIRLGIRVESIYEGGVRLSSGEEVKARAVVIATEGPEAARLLGEGKPPGSRSVTCLYFGADEPPVSEPILMLDGEGRGLVSNLCIPSNVAPSYAPKGKALLQATVLGNPPESDDQLELRVRSQLGEWFGQKVRNWKLLRIYRIRHALPIQTPSVPNPFHKPVRIRPWLYVAGEYGSVASIQWALASGRQAAEAILGMKHDS
jgi:phytoene dehydrogenase-like protein